MPLNIHPENITKFDHLVGVNYRQRMTPEVQQRYANNIAFQGYMWVPCFNKGVQTSVTQDTYIPHKIILPNVNLDVCVKTFSSATGTLTKSSFKLYSNDIQIVPEGAYSYTLTMDNMFTETEFFSGIGYILSVPKGSTNLRLDIQAIADTTLKPFTVFYRIRESS